MTVGCTVRLKDGPKYGGGALVFRHHPQYGPQVCRVCGSIVARTYECMSVRMCVWVAAEHFVLVYVILY